MKQGQKWTLVILLTMLAASFAATVLTRNWTSYRGRMRAAARSAEHSDLVNTQPLDTAQQLAPLAVTHTEKQEAQEALRAGDRYVDLAFAAALADAAANPAPPTKETRALAAKIKSLEETTAADEEHVSELKEQIAKARSGQENPLLDQLDLAQAQLALDQDDLEDAHQDFIRAGGDKQATIQKLFDRYKASQSPADPAHPDAATPTAPSATSAGANTSAELTKDHSIVDQGEALLSLHSKKKLLVQAREDALADEAQLSAAHDSLEKTLDEEKSQKRILPKTASPSPPSAPPPAAVSALGVIEHLEADQKDLAALDRRIVAQQQLAAAYLSWINVVNAREKSFLHGIFLCVFWIFLIAVLVWFANFSIRRFFAGLVAERRDLHMMSTLILLVVQGLGFVLILLVVLGVPSNFATLLTLVVAGITVVLRDFIIGFLGWFVLMGKDGIRPGDWVEINGVDGEVLEVGPFHTLLLETGNWADSAYPTGRKVSFVNSFAIEGHFFNFSTSGQWLWDEIQVEVSPDADPYKIADAMKKIAADDTSSNARLAQEEWQRVAPVYAKQEISAEPSTSVRPTGSSVTVVVRYITRASERQDVRARIYRAVVELLRTKNLPESSPPAPPASQKK
jgi:small-conductance mechanosensitive channel